MKIIKPDIVGHLGSKSIRHSIYSVDFQPNGNRLATGGGDSHVRLWSTVALLGPPEEVKEAMLSMLTSHSGSVNVVRWSKDGKYLASGSDDTYVFVYKYSSVSLGPTSFGSSSGNKASKCKESWPRCFTLQGHSMDVLDLDWSASGILASASIDNRVLIWDLGFQHTSSTHSINTGKSSFIPSIVSPVKILTGHQSFVRGVSFDPLMKYLATCGADNTLILWDTESWKESHRATEPLKDASDRALFTRLSWAPDGASLCITSSFKSAKPISTVLKRDTWQSAADLVGHRVETMSCRFLPCIVNHVSATNHAKQSSTDSSTKDGQLHQSKASVIPSCFVAVGDLEGVVTVWSSSRTRPVLALKEVFGGGVSDIAWTRLPSPASVSASHVSNGSSSSSSGSSSGGLDDNNTRVLFCASSIDGQVILVDLGTELGLPLNQVELDKHFSLLYGSTLQNTQSVERTNILDLISQVSSKPTGSFSNSLLSSDLQLSFMQNRPSISSLEAAVASMQKTTNGADQHQHQHQSSGIITATNDLTPANILALQKNSQTKSGKKRVCPVTIIAPTNDSDAPDLLAHPSVTNTNTSIPPSSSHHNVSVSTSFPRAVSQDKRVRFNEDTADDGHVFGGDDDPIGESAIPFNQTEPSALQSASSTANTHAVLSGRFGAVSNGFQPPLLSSSSTSSSVQNPSQTSAVSSASVTPSSSSSSSASVTPAPLRQRTANSNSSNAVADSRSAKGRTLSLTLRSDEQVVCIPLPLGPESTSSSSSSSATSESKSKSQIHAVVKKTLNDGPFHASTSSSLSQEYIVTAEFIRKPAYLETQTRLGQESMCRVILLRGSEVVWESVIMGLVTCICAQELRLNSSSALTLPTLSHQNGLGLGLGLGNVNGMSSSQSSPSLLSVQSIDGVCVVGCADGTIHLLSLRCGARIDTPLVLGPAVAFVDVENVGSFTMSSSNQLVGLSLPFVSNQSSSSSEEKSSSCRVMACTGDGSLRVWNLNISNAFGAITLQHKIVASVQPAVQSMKGSMLTERSSAQVHETTTADNNRSQSEVTVWLEKCQLDSQGCPVIVLSINSANSNNTNASSGNPRSSVSGGSYQGFRWSEDARVWLRVADMRHVLSRLFTVSSITDGKNSSNSNITSSDNTLTMSGIHNYTCKQNGFDLTSILDNASLYSSLDCESLSTSSRFTASGSQHSSETQAVRRWSELVTLSHAEERLCVALSYGSEPDALRWLGEWIFFCCKTNLKSRLVWLIESLVSVGRSSHHRNCATANNTSSDHLLENKQIQNSNHLLKTIVLPVIESSGCMKPLEEDLKRLIESLQ